MSFIINNQAHVSALIDETVGVVRALEDVRVRMRALARRLSVTQADAALGGQGAVFPPGFNVTPADIQNVAGVLAGTESAIAVATDAGEQGVLDSLRMNFGVQVGTG